MNAQEHLDAALTAYETAVFGGDAQAIADGEAHLDAVEADLVLARGRLAHARYLASGREAVYDAGPFERAAALDAAVDDVRGEGEATLWLAIHHQVVAGDEAGAEPLLRRAADLALEAGDDLTRSYALRHLCFVARSRGHDAEAWSLLEESTELRRGLGHRAGVAANLIGFGYMAAAQGRTDEARRHLAEAEQIARDAGAHGVLAWVADAREALTAPG